MAQRLRPAGGASRDAVEVTRRLEGIVASAMDAIITVDHDQRIVLFNPAAERMFAVTAPVALGQHISGFIPERFRGVHASHIARFTQTGATNRAMGSLGAISGLRANGEEFPIEASISQVEVGGERLATVILRDITERKANEDARHLLAREVDHRAKNALAVVQALVSLTRAPTMEAFIAAVRGRVSSLGRAHSLLARNRWEGAELAQIITDECAAYQRAGQVRIQCPPVVLAAAAVQPVGLLIHELATNAVKYGALSTDWGRVEVTVCLRDDGALTLEWSEVDGPTIQTPTVQGFGSTLIAQVVTRQLSGVLDLQWRPSGLRLVAILPAANFRIEGHEGVVAQASSEFTAAPRAAGDRLLVVEDEALVALELCDQLTELGWRIVGPAATVEEALRLIAEGALPDVAMLDINLRGQAVYPLADLLQRASVPFLFCTGYEQVEEPERYSASPVIRKPVNIHQLAEELHRLRPVG